MSDIWNEKNTVCWSPTKFIKEMNKLQALNAELEAELHATTEERDYWQMTAKKLTGIKAELAVLREEYAAYVKDCKANHYVKRSVWK